MRPSGPSPRPPPGRRAAGLRGGDLPGRQPAPGRRPAGPGLRPARPQVPGAGRLGRERRPAAGREGVTPARGRGRRDPGRARDRPRVPAAREPRHGLPPARPGHPPAPAGSGPARVRRRRRHGPPPPRTRPAHEVSRSTVGRGRLPKTAESPLRRTKPRATHAGIAAGRPAAAPLARRRDAAAAGSAAAIGSLPGCRPAPRGSRRHRARTRPGRGGPPCGRSPTRPGGRGRRTRRRGRGRPSRRSPRSPAGPSSAARRRACARPPPPRRGGPETGGPSSAGVPRPGAPPGRPHRPGRPLRRPRPGPSVPGRDVGLVGLDPALRPRRREPGGGPAPEPLGHGSNVGPAQVRPRAICRSGRFRPVRQGRGARTRGGRRRPAGAVPVRSSERAAHASRRWRWRRRRASPRPWRTTAALPHPGRRTPSGRRCRRTGAWRLASSIRDEGFADLPGTRAAAGLPWGCPPPTGSAAFARPHAQHPGSREEPAVLGSGPPILRTGLRMR